MGIWAEIKHALNNTLGTSDFKPLNQIVKEQATAVKNFVGSAKTDIVREIGHLEQNVESAVSETEMNVISDIGTTETNIKNAITSAKNAIIENDNYAYASLPQILSNCISDSKSLLESDEVFYNFPDALSSYKSVVDYSYDTALCSFTMPLAGSINLLYAIGLGAKRSDGTKISIVINKNGSQYYTNSSASNYSTTAPVVTTVALDCARGDVFEIRAVYNHAMGVDNTMTAYLNLYSLNATIKDCETINFQTLI